MPAVDYRLDRRLRKIGPVLLHHVGNSSVYSIRGRASVPVRHFEEPMHVDGFFKKLQGNRTPGVAVNMNQGRGEL